MAKKESIREKNAKKNNPKNFSSQERLEMLIALGAKIRCVKCGHIWTPRVDNPQRCPDCKQDWRIPYKNKR